MPDKAGEARAAKESLESIIDTVEKQKSYYGTGYDIAASAQSYRKALDQALKWLRQARKAM